MEKITSLKFAAYILAAILAALLVFNIGTIAASVGLILVIVVLVGAVPFLFGFSLQLVFRHKTIPVSALWIISAAWLTYTSYPSSKPRVFLFPDIAEGHALLKFVIFALSIAVYVGFMQTGLEWAQKIIKKWQHRKSLKRGATTEGRIR